MNAIVVRHPAAILAEIRAAAHLAHTQSRLAVQRQNWAREAERQGRPDLAARYADEAVKKRTEANWHLQWAMRRKDNPRYA